MNETVAMTHALALARRGWGRVAPNPMVGAVLLRDGAIVGEGYHAAFGGPHAEAAALAACDDPRGATCVVTLEPCAHHGKTPPCADALIEAGVARVVAALRDPHQAAGGGLARLGAAGVEVEIGVCAADAAALNAPFLWSVVRPERPFVAVKVATSLDGYLADTHGRSRWLSGPEARAWVHWLRAGFDAIAVGRETAERDDPELTVRGDIVPRVPPARVVFTRSGRLSRELRVVRTARDLPTYVLTAPEVQAETAQHLAGTGVTVIGADGPKQALIALRATGIRSLLVEGGGALIGGLLERDLVDRVCWVQTPRWLGRGVPAFGARSAVALDVAGAWTVVERRSLGADTLLVVDRELCLPAS